jgi:ectoine hydroxylase-related dioxygenase (phytanoyl-CoA dioxygenase family)
MPEYKLSATEVDFFNENGYLLVEDLLTPEEVEEYRNLYEDFLSNKIDASKNRGDLAGKSDGDNDVKVERITQIMVPSRVFPALLNQPLHQKSLAVARQLMGDDIALDFDMLIDKAPYTNAPTPWHQDCAYWISMPDTRAASCWVALDEAVKENGCMWYVPKSHLLPIRQHRSTGNGSGALQCDADEAEAVAIELKPGSCVFHHGATLHYSRGNSTGKRRRAFITNFRPEAMIRFERDNGYDHTGEIKVRNDDANTSL